LRHTLRPVDQCARYNDSMLCVHKGRDALGVFVHNDPILVVLETMLDLCWAGEGRVGVMRTSCLDSLETMERCNVLDNQVHRIDTIVVNPE
jgi:hypothetical protein